MECTMGKYQPDAVMSPEEAVEGSPFIGSAAKQKSFPAVLSRGNGMHVDEDAIREMIGRLDAKPYWPGRAPGVSRENPGFSDAPLPEEFISIANYMANMTALMNFLQQE